MSKHRLVPAIETTLISTCRSNRFSNFDFVDEEFGDIPSIRRLFSQARSYGCETLIIEKIPAEGDLQKDNEELKELFPDFTPNDIKRLSFWKKELKTIEDAEPGIQNSLLGFAILKHDVVPSKNKNNWYVFESVLIRYPHKHNFVRTEKTFHVRIGNHEFTINGALYCQQNALNKTCAQVAIRSLLGTFNPEQNFSYKQINQLAYENDSTYTPWKGMEVQEIRRVLQKMEMGFFDIDYSGKNNAERAALLPYQKLIYAGIESGGGALLGFQLQGPGICEGSQHIIPFFGHTFNQDTWVPHADTAYFHVGENTKYIPSESWVSSFIGHDDNFGSNFCIPRLYIGLAQANYAAEIFTTGCAYSGVKAEAIAIDYLYSILPQLVDNKNTWSRRLLNYVQRQQVVLRAICIDSDSYINHWKNSIDWNNNVENKNLCDTIKPFLPKQLWLIEISVPELFPANQRKIGEIVLNACEKATTTRDFKLFVLARIPDSLILLREVSKNGVPLFQSVQSQLASHTPLFEK